VGAVTGRPRASPAETADRLAEPAYPMLGAEGCPRPAAVNRPQGRVVVKAGLLNPTGLRSTG
jgi:hypothetical protein